ncbi:hypothetical protein BJX66DRAFT_31501 [Aspergillus keveii]|uniref:Uncharacterized protein n=1 Tax=Aspergillus keveii TaxID=714993 RepID=A0ABR4FT23_9EURO
MTFPLDTSQCASGNERASSHQKTPDSGSLYSQPRKNNPSMNRQDWLIMMSQTPKITGVNTYCPHFCSPENNSLVSPISNMSDRDYSLGTLPSLKEET